MSSVPNSADSRSETLEPDAHGQAALMLAESILNALVEGQILSLDEARSVIRTASEIKIEVALDAGESNERMIESLNLLSDIGHRFR